MMTLKLILRRYKLYININYELRKIDLISKNLFNRKNMIPLFIGFTKKILARLTKRCHLSPNSASQLNFQRNYKFLI